MRVKISCIFVILLLVCEFVFLQCSNELVHEYFPISSNDKLSEKSPSVLIMRFHKNETGVQHHVLALYKLLLNLRVNVNIIVIQGTTLQQRLYDEQLHHYSVDDQRIGDDAKVFYTIVNEICVKHNVDILHIHGSYFELKVAQLVSKSRNLNVIQQYHSYRVPKDDLLKGADAVILASPEVAKILSRNVKNNQKLIKFIPPLLNEDKFSEFVPKYTRDEFFKKNFGIKIKKCPILCVVANFAKCKNHEKLFKAVEKLIFKEKKDVQLVLAGKGKPDRINKLKSICKKLKIDENVYFLGFVESIPELLFHSDIKILPSMGDAFPISILEAALMKKPIILSKNAGSAGMVIVHDKTGLLCNPNDPNDIALQIKKILDDKFFATKIANNVYELVSNSFLQNTIGLDYLNLYKRF